MSGEKLTTKFDEEPKIVCRGRADINAGNYHTNVFQENEKSDKSIS